MKKKTRYTIPTLLIGLLVFNIGTTIVITSCTSDMPRKDPPAYFINIQFPHSEPISTINIALGKSITLPVIVTSNSEVPIYIRLTQNTKQLLPGYITCETQQDFTTLQPGENTTLYVTYSVSTQATLESYTTGIHGELKEPVPSRSLMTQDFNIVVTDFQSEGEQNVSD